MTAEPLSKVQFDELRHVWPKVRPQLQALREEHGEPWLPEDVFHEILMGGTHLWTTPADDGFVVLQVLLTPYSKDLHVWIACNRTAARAADYWEQLKTIAADNDCNRLIFGSPRKGWERAMPHLRVRYVLSETIGE